MPSLFHPEIDDFDPVLRVAIQRTQLGLWIILVSNVVFGAKGVWMGVTSLPWLFKGLQVAPVLLAFWALRYPYFQHRTSALSLSAFITSTVMATISGAISHDGITTPLLCIAMTLAASAVLPWGPFRQLLASTVAAGAILLNGLFVGQLGYLTAAALVAVAASVFIAHQLEEQRLAEQRVSAILREREQFLRLIANGLPALIAYIDADQRCRFANRAFEDWFGLARTVMYGQPMEEFIVPEALVQLRPHIDAALTGREVSFEAVFVDRYGHKRTFAITYVPDTTASGAVRGFFSLASDVTERKQAEDAVRQHQAQLAHALRLRTMGEMAAALAHELNQPLAAITAYATSCTLSLPPETAPEVRAQVEQIANEAMRAGEVIRRVQNFARRVDPKWEPVNLNRVVEEAVRLVETEAHQLRIDLRLKLAPTLPLVEADSIQIEQVIINLLLNAFQAIELSRNGRRRVEVETMQRQDGQLELAVRDTGVGLPAGIAKKIFEPYFTTRPDGLGMGLAISRSIIEAHGGRLWASANPSDGTGTTFRFNLPCSRPVASERAAS